MTLPIAVGIPGVRVIAFEPNRTSYRVLCETLRLNNVTEVEVHQQAVSDQVGVANFTELDFDPTGGRTWWPEASSITTEAMIDSTIPKAQFQGAGHDAG